MNTAPTALEEHIETLEELFGLDPSNNVHYDQGYNQNGMNVDAFQ